MPVTLKDHLESMNDTPMFEYYAGVGVTPATQAQTGKELLEAVTPKLHKLKGWFDRTVPMADGFSVIKGTTEETLIEELLADNAIRLKAWIEISKQMALYPSERISVKHGFDTLVGEVVREMLKNSKGVPPLPSEEKE